MSSSYSRTNLELSDKYDLTMIIWMKSILSNIYGFMSKILGIVLLNMIMQINMFVETPIRVG